MPKRNNEIFLILTIGEKHACFWHCIDHFIIIRRVGGTHYRLCCVETFFIVIGLLVFIMAFLVWLSIKDKVSNPFKD